MTSLVIERFQAAGALLGKLFGGRSRDDATFAESAGKVRETGIRMAVILAAFMVVLSSLAAAGTALVYWLGGRAVISGTLTLGTVIAFAAYSSELYSVVVQLATVRAGIVNGLVSFERVFEVLDFCEAKRTPSGMVELTNPQGQVEFESVSFRYPSIQEATLPSLSGGHMSGASDQFALTEASFSVTGGQTLAIVGPSGAGKTTLGLLVAGIQHPQIGSVRIDGVDLRDLSDDSLRRTVGVVSQDPHLFHDTIANNLRYADPDASQEDLVRACEAARIHELIASLPDGYSTVVGDRGYRLSGGEKQRVAIARVLLRNPPIVVLDEATSHLDPTSETLVRGAIKEALAGRTAVVIAHRMSTIEGSDSVLVLKDGRIEAMGPPDLLMREEGIFREMFGPKEADPLVTTESGH
jgi:ATP-binding cassette subfamily B protein